MNSWCLLPNCLLPVFSVFFFVSLSGDWCYQAAIYVAVLEPQLKISFVYDRGAYVDFSSFFSLLRNWILIAEDTQAQPPHCLGQLQVEGRNVLPPLLSEPSDSHPFGNLFRSFLFSFCKAVIPCPSSISNIGQVTFDDRFSDIGVCQGDPGIGKERGEMSNKGQVVSQGRNQDLICCICHGENGRSGCLEVVGS